MSGARVEVFGLAELLTKLRGLNLKGIAGVKDVVATSGLAIQRGAKVYCPVRTGRLRASIALRFYQSGLTAEVGTNVVYGPVIEYGGRGRMAKPFMQPALDDEREKFLRAIERVIKEAAA